MSNQESSIALSENIYCGTNQLSNYQNIPEEIRKLPDWVVWKYEVASNGRPTKIPYQINGRKASSTDPATWTTFDEAVAACQRFDGIGWCIPIRGVTRFYWGIDVDDAIDPKTGELRTWDNAPVQPKEFLELASYAEVTPSGAGFRIIAKSLYPVPSGQKKKEFGARNPKTGKVPGVECYSSGRFFTFTGNVFGSAPQTVEDRSEQIRAIHTKIFQVEKRQTISPTLQETARNQSTVTKDGLLLEILDGRIPDTSRNNLTVGIMGVLVSAGWDRADIEEIVGLLITSFHEADPAYDVPGNLKKQSRTLDSHYSRKANGEIVPGFKFLSETLTSTAISRIRTLISKPPELETSTIVTKTFERLKTRMLRHMEVPRIEYLCDPYIVKHGLTAITGEAGHGKSTFLHRLLHLAANKDKALRVIYADRDNAISFVKQRSETLSVGLEDRISYWSGGDVDADGNIDPPWNIDDPKWLDLTSEIKEAGEEPVFVFDTLNSFMNGQNENDNAVVGNLCCYARKMCHAGATVVIIHHTGKSATSKEARGASAFKGSVDALWVVESDFEEDRPSMIKEMRIVPKKSRLGDGMVFRYEMKDGVPTLRDGKPTDAEVLEFIGQHEGKSKEAIINAAKGRFTRQLLRDSFTRFLLGKQLRIEKKAVHLTGRCATSARAKPEPAVLLFAEEG